MNAIDLKKIIASKSPLLSKLMPGFAVRGVERLIRLERINYVLTTFGEQAPLEFIASTLDYIGVTYSVHSATETRPDRVIYASNHPLGGLDGLILALALATPNARDGSNDRGIRLIVNDLLMNLEPLRPIFVPVNKHGKQGAQAAQAHDTMYRSENDVITFPAGLCSRLIKGQITDTPWRKTFVQKALRYGRPIVPIYIDGANSRAFYRLAQWRKRLRIGANLEMALLPKEMFDQRGQHITIYIGTPIVVDASRSADEWTHEIRKKCYELRNQRSL